MILRLSGKLLMALAALGATIGAGTAQVVPGISADADLRPLGGRSWAAPVYAGYRALRAEKPLVGERDAAAATVTPALAGFTRPTAVRYDAQTDRYIVGNAPDGGLAKTNRGFISKVAAPGKLIQLKWIEGGRQGVELNAPKGMDLRAGVLYVADIDQVRMFDSTSGRPVRSIEVRQAFNLTDVRVADDGTIYASDAGRDIDSGALFAIEPDRPPRIMVRGASVLRPSALAIGPGDRLTLAPSIGSNLVQVDRAGRVVGFGQFPMRPFQPSVVRGGERLGGIVLIDERMAIVSSWEAGEIGVVTLKERVRSPIDLRPRARPQAQAQAADAHGRANTAAPHGRNAPSPSYAFIARTSGYPGKLDIDTKRNFLIVPEMLFGNLFIISIARN